MKRVILMGFSVLLLHAANAQGRVRQSSLPLGVANRAPVGYNRNIGSLSSVIDTFSNYGRATVATASLGSPTALRFSDVQAQCDQNSMVLQWEAVQQANADKYEIEQSDDQRTWRIIGVVPANRTEFGRAAYSFTYSQNTGTSLFRISAITTGGERVFSQLVESPCGTSAYLALTPNPVYSTTTLRIGSPATARVKLAVLDSRGSMVYVKEATLMSGVNNVSLEVSSLPAGNYTLYISWYNGKQETLTLIKK